MRTGPLGLILGRSISETLNLGLGDDLVILFLCLVVIAMAMSLGKRVFQTKACKRVVTKRPKTVIVATVERSTAKTCVKRWGTCSEYLIVAIDVDVIG